MIIDFNKIEEKEHANFKGGEKSLNGRMYNDGTNIIMRAVLVPGASVGLHTHEGNCEIVYVIEGSGKVLYDDTEERVCAGQVHYCPENHTHSLINDTDKDLVFFAVVPKQ